MTRWLLAAIALLLLAPASASAHSTIQVFGQEIVYASEDAISDNQLTVTETATEVVFDDPEADNGIQATDARCRVTATSGSLPTRIACRKAGLTRVAVDAGPNEDRVAVTLGAQWELVGVAGGAGRDQITVSGPSADVLSGDQGADVIDGGDGADDIRGEDGADTIRAGAGNDRVQAGPGADDVEGGDGDDEILTPDGVADRVSCGPGNDRARADTLDDVNADCEDVQRTFVAPPSDGGAGADDRTKPRVRVGGSTIQRLNRKRRTIKVAVTSSEKGSVSASGFLDANGYNLPLTSREAAIEVAGGGVMLKVKVPGSAVRHVMRDYRRGRRPRARIHVAATDAAGNTAVARVFKLRLRR